MIGLYARVSTDGQNVRQQLDLLKEYCVRNGLKYRSYVDEGVSGELSERFAWSKLLNDCDKGLIKTILVTKYDRVTRSLDYALKFLDWLFKGSVRLVSLYDGEFLGTPDNIFTFKLKCLLSEYELDQLRWRSKIGIERAKREGKYKGRKKGAKNRGSSKSSSKNKTFK